MKHVGSTVDNFLAEAVALKRVLAFHPEQEMQRTPLEQKPICDGVLGKRLKPRLI